VINKRIKRPALRYYGGKWNLAPWIISHLPPHHSFIDLCGGGASVLLRKERSNLETYNDLDGNVVNFFRVLRDEPDALIQKIKLTPWAREEHELSRQSCEDKVESARRFFCIVVDVNERRASQQGVKDLEGNKGCQGARRLRLHE